ncbi:nuclear transport factor 2 family protein [Chitinophaga pendula]|uniref:nuclear transport factor 2 family protein n=1 Tax=Chitinophaga TaxID=79328 RepID=UPI000BB0C28E|nr:MULTISPECIES: nuclear transport factor 2 family protein [Chitinophaga]ASZ13973.1 hypothetical protein CK934_24980 [Chitinophaga sp. MD30]UCJ08403.1 nuclear transport factor 2 family protein [Chitinophaga pendula]
MQLPFSLPILAIYLSSFIAPPAMPIQSQADEEAAVKRAIGQMFTGMRNGDSSMVKDVFTEEAVLQSIATDAAGKTKVRTTPIAAFVKAVGTPHTDVWDEQIIFDKISIDDQLAAVWTPYNFYLGNKFSHCGVNSFQLAKVNGKWKIVYLIDTRRKINCLTH